MRRNLFAAAIVALLAGCATDVVDFSLQELDSEDKEWKCAIIDERPGERCQVCKHVDTGETKEVCEELVCKFDVSDDEDDISCKKCWWSEHDDKPCEICRDRSGDTVSDTCHKNEMSDDADCYEDCLNEGADKESCKEICGEQAEEDAASDTAAFNGGRMGSPRHA
jgi:hypothetical protein